jgi:hypothetical protein
VIGRNGVNAGLHIGEVLHKKPNHFRVNVVAVWHWRIGMGPPSCSRLRAFSSSRGLDKPAQREAVPKVPGDARQLAHAVSETGDHGGNWRTHIFCRYALCGERTCEPLDRHLDDLAHIATGRNMGFDQDQIVPLLINLSMQQKNLAAYRSRVVSAAEGGLLEIGIGSGPQPAVLFVECAAGDWA